MFKIGLDWCLKDKPRKAEYVTEISRIKTRMKELDNLDFKDNPEAKKESGELNLKLSELQICPEETVGMRRLKELSLDEQKKAFEEYAVPRIRDAKAGKGHDSFNKYWKDMTFGKWLEKHANNFLEHEIPGIMKDLPRTFGPFQSLAGWMSFRGKCIGNSEMIPSNLRNEAYSDMNPEQMIEYAAHLEIFTKEWEQKHSEILSQLENYKEQLNSWNKDNDWMVLIGKNEEQMKEHKQKMKAKYGNEFIGFKEVLNDTSYGDYKILKDAITWLRFWSERGHGMWAWY